MINLNKKTKIVLITSIYTPFWYEFLKEFQSSKQFELFLIFTTLNINDRGNHWINLKNNSNKKYMIMSHSSHETSNILNQIDPMFVIIGGIKIRGTKGIIDYCKNNSKKYGFFLEQPNKRTTSSSYNIIYFILNLLNKVRYFIKLQLYRPNFILAVGDRAVEIYKILAPKNCDTFFFSYSQKLTDIKSKRFHKKDKVNFLFSGRLLPRNSIRLIMNTFILLSKSHPGKFSLCISAFGPEEKYINFVLSNNNELSKSVYFDRDFENWEDRLNPFLNSDVLLLPSTHSGWGLVVPEALSLGLPVVTTSSVEASRYYIDNFVNGVIIKPKKEELYKVLSRLIDNRNLLLSLKMGAHNTKLSGSLIKSVKRMTAIFEFLSE